MCELLPDGAGIPWGYLAPAPEWGQAFLPYGDWLEPYVKIVTGLVAGLARGTGTVTSMPQRTDRC